MALDLSGIQSFVEDNLMDDDCIITRDAAGTSNDTWFPETGEYAGPDPDTIYEGDCWFSMGGQQPNEGPIGGSGHLEEIYYVNIPLGAAEIKDGDMVTCRVSLRMPQLVNKMFRAQVVEMGTFKIKQKVRLTRYTPQALR